MRFSRIIPPFRNSSSLKFAKMATSSSSATERFRFNAQSTADEVLSFNRAETSGKVYFVTGATSGIGLETARALAKNGASCVFMAGRDMTKLQTAVEGVRKELPPDWDVNSRVRPILCDLSSLRSVKSCIEEFSALNIPLNCLINNAGCWLTGNPDRVLTEDGIEMHIGTNHLGHFALTNGLMACLKAAGNARVVNVASMAHGRSPIRFGDENMEKEKYDPFTAYGQSKTANILHAKGLHDRYYADGIVAVSLHPGVIETELWRNGKIGASMNKTIPQGAATQVYCSVSRDIVPGAYYSDCKELTPNAWATNKEAADRLWDWSAAAVERALKK